MTTGGQLAQRFPSFSQATFVRWRAVDWARISVTVTLGIGVALAVSQVASLTPLAQDAGVYWRAVPGDLYGSRWAWDQAPYGYSPAFADALTPLRLLPERVFTALWQFMLVALLAATARGWALPAILLAFAPWPLNAVGADIAMGNIHVLLGAVAVFGLRWPALWSIALLSKVTPGVGIIWFAARKEWRNLGVAVGATVLIAGVAFLLSPGDWFAWLAMLQRGTDFPLWVVPIALPARVAMSAVLVFWGARTDRAWVVPIACGWAIPIPYATMLGCMVAAIGAQRSWAAVTDRHEWAERSSAPLPVHSLTPNSWAPVRRATALIGRARRLPSGATWS